MEALFARRQRRGMTWVELAEESGVPRSTLHWWYRRLREERKPRKARPRFVQVDIHERARAGESQSLEVVLRSGHRVRVSAGFDPEHLRRVIVVLESGC